MTGVPARYFDGKSAAERPVRVWIDADTLRVQVMDDATALRWPLAEVEAVPGGEPLPLRLRHRPDPDARLVIHDSDFAEALRPRLPRPRDQPGWRSFAIGGAATAAFLAAIWLLLPVISAAAAKLVPPGMEARWGARIEAELFGKTKRCESPAGRAALDALLTRLASAGDVIGDRRFELSVADLPIVNALALPGGRMILLRGFLKEAETPEEVAGVLAHEMGHVIARHHVRSMIWAQGLDLVTTLLLGNTYGGGAAHRLLSLSHTRADEREADAIGLDLLSRGAISSDGFAAFFARQNAKQGGGGDGLFRYLSTHPPDPERAARALDAKKTATPPRPALSPDEWKALKAICETA